MSSAGSRYGPPSIASSWRRRSRSAAGIAFQLFRRLAHAPELARRRVVADLHSLTGKAHLTGTSTLAILARRHSEINKIQNGVPREAVGTHSDMEYLREIKAFREFLREVPIQRCFTTHASARL